MRPGQRVSDYPQLSTRIPVETYQRLHALATIHGIPQWRVMSGLDVCRRIKSDGRFGEVKIVQTSATFSSPHDQLEGLEAGGADLYLAEPVPRGTLLSIVRRFVDYQPSAGRSTQ